MQLKDEAGLTLGEAAALGAPALIELDLRCNELTCETKDKVRAGVGARNAKLLAAIDATPTPCSSKYGVRDLSGVAMWNECFSPPLACYL